MKNIAVKLLGSLFILFFFSACLTLTNTSRTELDVYSEIPILVVHDSVEYTSRQDHNYYYIHLAPKRQKADLELTIKDESKTTQLNIPSKLDKKIYYNLLVYGVGFIPDFMSDKRFTYPKQIFVDSLLNIHQRYKLLQAKRQMDRKGVFFLNLGFPYVNFFSYKSSILNDRKNEWGFIGLSLGADYYYHHNRFVNITVGANMNFMAPFPAPVHYDGVHDHFSSIYVQLTNNHRISKFSLGYGLAFSQNWWRMDGYLDEFSNIYIDISESSSALGLALNPTFTPNEKFYVGVNYRPSFVKFSSESNPKLCANHYLSFDFGFKIQLNKRKKRH